MCWIGEGWHGDGLPQGEEQVIWLWLIKRLQCLE